MLDRPAKSLVGKLLNRLRRNQGATLKDFAEVSGKSVSQLSGHEHGAPPLSPFQALALLFNFSTRAQEPEVTEFIATVPALAQQLEAGELITQAEEGGQLDQRGLGAEIARESGLDGQVVRRQIRSRRDLLQPGPEE